MPPPRNDGQYGQYGLNGRLRQSSVILPAVLRASNSQRDMTPLAEPKAASPHGVPLFSGAFLPPAVVFVLGLDTLLPVRRMFTGGLIPPVSTVSPKIRKTAIHVLI